MFEEEVNKILFRRFVCLSQRLIQYGINASPEQLLNLSYDQESKQTCVMNIRGLKDFQDGPDQIYIGRQNFMSGYKLRKSKWFNPFKLEDYGNNRVAVLEAYRRYILSRPDLLSSFHELKGKKLYCWCKPELCHGDVLVELVRQYYEE